MHFLQALSEFVLAWKTGLLCLCCVALGACVYQRPDFPRDWAPLETGRTDCFAINGVYANIGVAIGSDNTRSKVGLDQVFFRDPKRWELRSANNVAISVTKDGILEVAAWPSNQSFFVMKQSFEYKGEYRCDRGTIQLSYGGAGSEQGVSGVASGTTYITKSTDGALVVRDSAVAVALLLVVPAGGVMQSWYRFERSTATKPIATTEIPTDQSIPATNVQDTTMTTARSSGGKLIIKRDPGLLVSGCEIRTYINRRPLANLSPGEVVTAYLDAGEYIVGAFSGICGFEAEAQLVLREGEARTYRISFDQGASVRLGPTAQ